MKNPTLLVIEGDTGVSKLFFDVFTGRDWAVDVCNDGPQAAEAINSSRPYDVIIVSYRVPEANGIYIVQMIRSLSHREDTPVIMVSGSGNIDQEAYLAGADEVWHKPVELMSFVSAVEKRASTASRGQNVVA